MQPTTPQFFTAAEIADIYRVRPCTVRKWTRDGLIPSMKISAGVTRYDPTKVAAALTAASSDGSSTKEAPRD